MYVLNDVVRAPPSISIDLVSLAIMAWIFSNAPSTYAFEQLNHSLSALSTIPISVPESLVADVKASPTVENGLRELSRAKPITKEHLIQVLETLTNSPDSSSGNNAGEASQTAVKTPVDKVVEAEIMARAVTVLWKETLEAAMAGAMELEQERVWWEGIIGSRTNVGLYFVQCEFERAVLDVSGSDRSRSRSLCHSSTSSIISTHSYSFSDHAGCTSPNDKKPKRHETFSSKPQSWNYFIIPSNTPATHQ